MPQVFAMSPFASCKELAHAQVHATTSQTLKHQIELQRYREAGRGLVDCKPGLS